jgi:hypothetical protein
MTSSSMKYASAALFLSFALVVAAFGRPGPDSNFNKSISGGGGGTPTFVQGNNHNANTASSCAVTLGATVGSGNLVVFAVGAQSGSTATVADDKGNTYTAAPSPNPVTGNSYEVFMFYLGNITNGPITMTATLGASRTFVQCFAEEYSGMATSPFDVSTAQFQATPGTTADAVTSGNATTTVNGDLIWAITASTNTSTFSVGTSFTQRQSVAGEFMTESRVQSTAGAVAGTFRDTSNGSDITGMMAFKHL